MPLFYLASPFSTKLEEESKAVASQIARSQQGMIGLLDYWKPFEAHTVERVLADHGDCVIDFGAGYTVHEDEALFSRV